MPLGPPILWPLRTIGASELAARQAGLRPLRGLAQPVFLRQRPRSVGLLLAPDVPINLPWNAIGSPGLTDLPYAFPRVIHELRPTPPTYFRITGTTRDSTGAALGSCTVDWFNTADDVKLDSTTSDANGLYEFRTAGQPPNAYYLVAYKSGSPDVAGTTVSTLVGT